MSIIEFCDRHHACEDGREWALANCQDMDHAWDVLKPEWLVWVATRKGVLDDRTLRLFAVWCARQVQHLMTDPRSVAALDAAERFANGEAAADELAAAGAAAGAAAVAAARAAADAACAAADAAADAARAAAVAAAWAAAGAAAARAAAWAAADAADAADAARDAARAAAWAAADAADAARAAAVAAALDESIKLQADWLRANAKPRWEAKP